MIPVFGIVAAVAGCASPAVRAPESGRFDAAAPIGDTIDSEAPGADASFDTYARWALERNPELRAARARVRAAVARVPVARALANPELSFEYALDPQDMRFRVGLNQMLPAFGKRGWREAVARAEAEAAAWRYESERLEFVERLARAYFNYRYLASAIAAAEENLHLLDEMENVANARLGSGASSYADRITVSIERERQRSELSTLLDRRRAQSTALAALLGLPTDAQLPWPKADKLLPTLPEETVTPTLPAANPELRAIDARIEAARRRLALARRENWPDAMVGAGWTAMPGMDGGGDQSEVGVMIGVSLPVWRGAVVAGVREAKALLEEMEQEREALRLRLCAEWSEARAELRDAERRQKLFAESLSEQATRAWEVARQAYAEGNGEFAAVIEAQRLKLDIALQAERAAADRAMAVYRIARLSGRLLEYIGAQNTTPVISIPTGEPAESKP